MSKSWMYVFAAVAVCGTAAADELPSDVKGWVAGIEADLKNAKRYLAKGDAGYVDYYLKSAAKYWKRIEAAPKALDHAKVKAVLAEMNKVRAEAKLAPLGAPAKPAPSATPKPNTTPTPKPSTAPTPHPSPSTTKAPPPALALNAKAKGHLMWLSRALSEADRYLGKKDMDSARGKLEEAKGYFVQIRIDQPGALDHPKIKPERSRYLKLGKALTFDVTSIHKAKQGAALGQVEYRLQGYSSALKAGMADRAKEHLAAARAAGDELSRSLLPEQRTHARVSAALKKVSAAASGGSAAADEVAGREGRVKQTGANVIALYDRMDGIWKRMRQLMEKKLLDKMSAGSADEKALEPSVVQFESLARERVALLAEAEATVTKFTEFTRDPAFAKFLTKDMRVKGDWLASARRSHHLYFGQWLAQLSQTAKNGKVALDRATKDTGASSSSQLRAAYAAGLKNVAAVRLAHRLLRTLLPLEGGEWKPTARDQAKPGEITQAVEHCLEQQIVLAKRNGEKLEKEALRLSSARFPAKKLGGEYKALESTCLALAKAAYKKDALRVSIVEPWRERHGWFRHGNQVEWEDFRYVGTWVALQDAKDPKLVSVFYVTYRQMLQGSTPGKLEVWGISGGFSMLKANVAK